VEIILLETLNKLGKAGELVKVKDGFARNFLIPNKKAIIANKKNKEDLDSKMSQINKNNVKKLEEAKLLKEALDGKKIIISMEANEEGNLFGSVSQKNISTEVNKQLNLNIESDSILTGQIKSLGTHEISIRLYDTLSSKLELEIISSSKL
tara:strand:- start:928 stop:1380 length:453 start_codon:yes stop_codon:yes gene_type:complete